MTVFLKVIGEKISQVDYLNKSSKKPSRKVFYADWGKAGEYEHEIGNHYRDYKNRKFFHRNFKRRRHHQRVLFEEQPFVFRDVLPLNRLNFPESNCDSYHQLFNDCSNKTLQKISSTNSLSELQFLAKRQERLFKHKKVPRLCQGQLNHCYSNDLISIRKARFIRKNENRPLGHIDTILKDHYSEPCYTDCKKVIWEGVSTDKCIEEVDFSNDIENYFFRLASECYDEGFLAHIKYLQSIVDHNAIRKTKSIRTKQSYKSENTESDSQSSSVVSSVSSNNSLEDLSTTSIGEGKFASTVKRLLKNRQLNNHNSPKKDRRDLKICVNINRSTSLESLNSKHCLGHKPPLDSTTINRSIMTEFLNSADTVSRGIVDTNTGSTIKRQHFHDLIENLNKLEISDSGLLPKITISLADDNTKASLTSTETSERTIRKQDSLEVGVPFLNDYYNSEARPP